MSEYLWDKNKLAQGQCCHMTTYAHPVSPVYLMDIDALMLDANAEFKC